MFSSPQRLVKFGTMKTAVVLLLVVIASIYVNQSDAVNILLLESVPSPSHHLWLSKLSIELASKGYNVTSLSADIGKKPTPNLHYLHLDKVYELLYNSDIKVDFLELSESSAWYSAKMYREAAYEACVGAIRSTGWRQLQAYPDNFKFDLVIHDHLFGSCLLGFLKKFRYPPMMAVTASNDLTLVAAMFGNVLRPSTSTHLTFRQTTKNFFDRFENYLMQVVDYYARKWYLIPSLDKVIKEHGNMIDIRPGNELMKLTKIALINYDSALDPPEHFPSNVIAVGGMQIRPTQPLPEDLQAIADNAKGGLVLFSLGTNVPIEDMGEAKITHILEAFRKLPEYTFICKFVLVKSPVPVPKNVIMRKFLPQNDILGHNNTKLFITHSGLLSTQESIWHGVPMLGMPVFADQFINIDKAVQKGLGGRVYWNQLSTDTLYTEIKKLLTEPSYRKNIKIVSNVFRDQKETPLERAVWWVEWMMRNPDATHMRYEVDLNLIQLQSIDVLAVIFILIVLAFWLIKIVLIGLLRFLLSVCSSGTAKKTKRE